MALVDNGGTQNSETAFSLAQELLLEMLDQNFNVVSLCTQQGLMFLTGLPSPDDPYPLLLKNDLQKAIVFLREEYTAEFSCRVTAVVPAGEDFSRTSAMLMEQLSQMRLLPYSSPLPTISGIIANRSATPFRVVFHGAIHFGWGRKCRTPSCSAAKPIGGAGQPAEK